MSNEKLAMWAETVKASAANGWRTWNAFNMGLFYGADGLAKVPVKNSDGGELPDDVICWFNIGVQYHEDWKAAGKEIRPALLKALVALATAVIADLFKQGKK